VALAPGGQVPRVVAAASLSGLYLVAPRAGVPTLVFAVAIVLHALAMLAAASAHRRATVGACA